MHLKQDPITGALEHLRAADPVLHAAALPHVEGLRIRYASRKRLTSQKLFEALAESVVSQQLSVKAADTIWKRLESICGGTVTPAALVVRRVPSLRKAGLSAAKVKTLKELSKAILANTLTLTALRKVSEEDAILALSSIWGIGRWTAEMFLMFALERDDVFSAKDLGLRRSMETLYNLPKDVPIQELERISLLWAPHRTFASRVLWRIRDAQ